MEVSRALNLQNKSIRNLIGTGLVGSSGLRRCLHLEYRFHIFDSESEGVVEIIRETTKVYLHKDSARPGRIL